MKDFFSYDRTVHKPGEIASGDFGLVDIKGKLSLVLQAQVSYSQQLNPFYEIGTSDVQFIAGQPVGQFSASRAVNPTSGFWQHFAPGACGYIEAANLSLGGKGNCSVTPSGKGIHMQDLHIQNVSAGISAGAREISESVSAQFSFASN